MCVRLALGCIQVGPYRQSERGEIYKKMADKLVEAGWAYPCFCTEEELIAKREQVHSVCVAGNFLSAADETPRGEFGDAYMNTVSAVSPRRFHASCVPRSC